MVQLEPALSDVKQRIEGGNIFFLMTCLEMRIFSAKNCLLTVLREGVRFIYDCHINEVNIEQKTFHSLETDDERYHGGRMRLWPQEAIVQTC